MSLRYALLGLLAGEPASGYDLTQRFEKQMGMIWPAKHPQIYGELSKLAEADLIEIESEGPRGRKVYRITDAGRAEVRRWLTDEPVDHTMRTEPLLRSLFFWLMRPDELQEYLDKEAEYYREMTGIAQSLAAAKDRGDYGDSPQTKSMRVMIEAGVKLYEALADWAEWAKANPPTESDKKALAILGRAEITLGFGGQSPVRLRIGVDFGRMAPLFQQNRHRREVPDRSGTPRHFDDLAQHLFTVMIRKERRPRQRMREHPLNRISRLTRTRDRS